MRMTAHNTLACSFGQLANETGSSCPEGCGRIGPFGLWWGVSVCCQPFLQRLFNYYGWEMKDSICVEV